MANGGLFSAPLTTRDQARPHRLPSLLLFFVVAKAAAA
jgi:hypothetical protein